VEYQPRIAERTLRKYLGSFSIVGLTGPRQSGKSTTLREKFGDHYEYVTFDDPSLVEFFDKDPRGFLEKYEDGQIQDGGESRKDYPTRETKRTSVPYENEWGSRF